MPVRLNMLKIKHILQEKRAECQEKSLILHAKFAERVSEGFGSIEYMKHLQLTIVRPESSNLL